MVVLTGMINVLMAVGIGVGVGSFAAISALRPAGKSAQPLNAIPSATGITPRAIRRNRAAARPVTCRNRQTVRELDRRFISSLLLPCAPCR